MSISHSLFCVKCLLFISLAGLSAKEPFISVDFESLEGKDSSAWSHVREEEDFLQVRFYESLYEKNKWLQFANANEYRIPKIVHFIWIGPRCFPRESIENIRTWLANHPDWTFYFWTDRERPAPCKQMQIKLVQDLQWKKLKKIYDESSNWSQKADILTYEILYQYGGIYSDHDANSLRSFDNLNRSYDFYGCLEVPQERIGDFTLAVGHGLMGAKPYHPVIEKTIDILLERWVEVMQKYPEKSQDHNIKKIMEGSYIALTYAAQSALCKNHNQDIIFPASYFFAKDSLQPIYSKHFFAGTWVDNKKKKNTENYLRDTLGTVIKKMHIVSFMQYMLIGVLGIIFLSLMRKKR
jgi:hypothetical protein